MAMHSSIPRWRIPQTEEPTGLQSMGSQKSLTQLSDLRTTTSSALVPKIKDMNRIYKCCLSKAVCRA